MKWCPALWVTYRYKVAAVVALGCLLREPRRTMKWLMHITDNGQVNGSLDVSSVSGALNATLVSLNPQGIHIRSVSGSVELAFKFEVNADFEAQNVSGEVDLNAPNATRDSERSHPTYAHASAQEVRPLRFPACPAKSG